MIADIVREHRELLFAIRYTFRKIVIIFKKHYIIIINIYVYVFIFIKKKYL